MIERKENNKTSSIYSFAKKNWIIIQNKVPFRLKMF